MATLQAGGVEQTALHNHLLNEHPRVMYMHVHAVGDPVQIARTVRAALAKTGTPRSPAPRSTRKIESDLDTAAIERALGASGHLAGDVFQVGVPRRDTIRDGSQVIPPSMGVATGINFQPTGNGNAVVTGDFVMRAGEVNPVIRALQSAGIGVTALHSHMLDESPRLFFMHFWGRGNAPELARGLGRALDQMDVIRMPSR